MSGDTTPPMWIDAPTWNCKGCQENVFIEHERVSLYFFTELIGIFAHAQWIGAPYLGASNSEVHTRRTFRFSELFYHRHRRPLRDVRDFTVQDCIRSVWDICTKVTNRLPPATTPSPQKNRNARRTLIWQVPYPGCPCSRCFFCAGPSQINRQLDDNQKKKKNSEF